MSNHSSPMAGGHESDSMDDGRQALDLCELDTPQSSPTSAVDLDDEEKAQVFDLRPKLSLLERIRLDEERENELARKAKAQALTNIPEAVLEDTSPKREEVSTKNHKASLGKMVQIKQEVEEDIKEDSRKLARTTHEKYSKIQKDNYIRDFYWKPDPLYALHLKDLGYSKIAIDKALFYTDNKSAAKALEYLKKNPNPTELTLEEIISNGYDVPKGVRPKEPLMRDHTEQILSKEGEMEIEDESQSLLANDDCLTCITIYDDSPESKECKEASKEDPVSWPKNDNSTIGGNIKRGIKRTYDGDEIKSLPTTSKLVGHPLPPVREIPMEYKMIFIVNTSLLMDSITLSLEVGKVVANLTNKITRGTDEFKKMFDEWTKDGNKMTMYKGNNNNHLTAMYNSSTAVGFLTYLAQCSHYRHLKTPSPTILGIFGDTKQLENLCNNVGLL